MSASTAAKRGSEQEKESSRGFFARIVLFIRQVIDELRKVVRPTRDELVTYVIALLVFLAFIMAFVVGIDQLIVRLIDWVFG